MLFKDTNNSGDGKNKLKCIGFGFFLFPNFHDPLGFVRPRIMTETPEKEEQLLKCVHRPAPPASTESRGPGTADVWQRKSHTRPGAPGPGRPPPAYLVEGRARVRLGAQRGHGVPVVGARPGGSSAGAPPQG